MDSFSNDWEQVKAYIRDLELLLTDDAAELQSLDELKRIRLDLRALILGREQDARRVIQEMNSRVQHASATAAQYEPTIDEVSRRLEAVDLRRKTLMDELHGMKAAKDVSQKRLQEVARAMTALKQQQAAVVADASAQVPRVKCVEGSGFSVTALSYRTSAASPTFAAAAPLVPHMPASTGTHSASTPTYPVSDGTTTRTMLRAVS